MVANLPSRHIRRVNASSSPASTHVTSPEKPPLVRSTSSMTLVSAIAHRVAFECGFL